MQVEKNKYFCKNCGKELKTSFGHPDEAVCTECREALLAEHANDDLKECPFCHGTLLQHALFTPIFYGIEGVRVVCKTCGAASGVASIKRAVVWDCPDPPLYNHETIEDGFTSANEKWNLRGCLVEGVGK